MCAHIPLQSVQMAYGRQTDVHSVQVEGGMVNLENEISTRSKHRTHSTSATEHKGTLLSMQPHHRTDLYICTCTHRFAITHMVHTALAMRTADAQAAVQCANMCCPGESAPFGDDRKWLSVGSNAHPRLAGGTSRATRDCDAPDSAAARNSLGVKHRLALVIPTR